MVISCRPSAGFDRYKSFKDPAIIHLSPAERWISTGLVHLSPCPSVTRLPLAVLPAHCCFPFQAHPSPSTWSQTPAFHPPRVPPRSPSCTCPTAPPTRAAGRAASARREWPGSCWWRTWAECGLAWTSPAPSRCTAVREHWCRQPGGRRRRTQCTPPRTRPGR